MTGIVSQTGMELRDRRLAPSFKTRTVLARGSNAATIAGFIFERIQVAAGAYYEPAKSPPFVLGPGTALVVEQTVANSLLNVNFRGYERTAFGGELI